MMAAIALWLFFGFYWAIAARTAAANRSSETRASRLVHEILIGLAQLTLLLPVPGLRARFLPDRPAIWITGLAIAAASLAFTFWARNSLGRNWSAQVTSKVDHHLVRTGPYALVRHPIYTGAFGVYLGTMLVSGEVHALVWLPLFAIAYARKIAMEERVLVRTFGAEYEDYRRRTRAIIPGLF